MKEKYICILVLVISAALFSGCELDNYEPPTSILEGSVVHGDEPVGVRSGGTRLELWQKGYATPKKIDIFISQEGTYSARLFDGEYKLVKVSGAPWQNDTDSLTVQVKGNTILDVPVVPYYKIALPEDYLVLGDGAVTTTCQVLKVGDRDIESLTLYIGITNLVDANNNAQSHTLSGADLADLSLPKVNSVVLNSQLKERQYVYIRLGVKAFGIGERFYTPVEKINLPS